MKGRIHTRNVLTVGRIAGAVGILFCEAVDGAEARNRVSFSYRVGLNMTVDFKNDGGLPMIVTPQGVTLEGDEWNFINGYALVGESGSTTETPYWGHRALDPSKLPSGLTVPMLPFDPSLVNLYRYDASPAVASSSEVSHGGELLLSRVFGLLGSGHWGFEGGFGFGTLAAHSDFDSPISLVNDQYAIPGSPIPSLGYEGSREGTVPPFATEPWVLLEPVGSPRTAISDSAWSGERSFEADLYEFKFGPYAELPLSRRLSVNLSAGLTLAALRSELNVEQTIRLSDLAVIDPRSSGSVSEDEFLFGGYAGAQLWYGLSYRWSLFAGIQYQYLESSSLSVAGASARLNLGRSIHASIGIGFAY